MSLLKNIVRAEKTFSYVTLPRKPYFHTGISTLNDNRKFKAFKAKQAKMQCDDGYPVHLKGGIKDKILYHVTVGSCVIGVSQCFWLIYLLATDQSS